MRDVLILANFAALASCDDVSTVDESEELVSSGRANELIAATELAVANIAKVTTVPGFKRLFNMDGSFQRIHRAR